MEDIKDNEHKIEVISGDGSDLDISKVYNHLNLDEPDSSAPDKDKIVIPPEKKEN